MIRSISYKVAAGALSLAVLASSASDAFAGWRWHGSSGGSSGSSGGSSGWSSSGGSSGWSSSGGSSGWSSSGGSSGSSGGSSGWFHRHHHKRWHGSSGSSGGSSGSSGGSSGWHGSSGSSGGSSGGTYYYAPAEVEVQGVDPSTVPPATQPGDMTPGKTTSIRRADGLLAVSVPEDAKIYVNGAATSSTGADRSYVSRDLQNGMNYSYEVRAEVVRDGKTVEQVKTVNVRAGETARLAFDFAAAQNVETALTLHVPANAKVYLAGNQTSAAGELRVFRTTGLTAGKTWSDYTIRVEFEQDGQTVTQEKTIALVGGQSQELSFPQQVEKIAAR